MPYLANIGGALSRVLNALTFGHPAQTFSARLGHSRESGCRVCGWACRVLTWVFRDGDHCSVAMDADCTDAHHVLEESHANQ